MNEFNWVDQVTMAVIVVCATTVIGVAAYAGLAGSGTSEQADLQARIKALECEVEQLKTQKGE